MQSVQENIVTKVQYIVGEIIPWYLFCHSREIIKGLIKHLYWWDKPICTTTIKTSTPGYWKCAHVCILCVLKWVCVLCSVCSVAAAVAGWWWCWTKSWDNAHGNDLWSGSSGAQRGLPPSDQGQDVVLVNILYENLWTYLGVLGWKHSEGCMSQVFTWPLQCIAVLLRATKPADARGVVLLSNHSTLLRR